MTNKNLVKVIDAVMGTGKSTWAIDEIQKHPDRKYIILTPYLDEVVRYKEGISADYDGNRSDVVALDDKHSESKTMRFKQALKDDKTIIATHNLFLDYLDDDCFGLIDKGEYHLMLDETLTMVTEEVITEQDVNMLKKAGYLTEESTRLDGLVHLQPTDKALDYIGEHKILSYNRKWCLRER